MLNNAAGKPAKTVVIIHEESLFGTGTAKLLARELPGDGFEVKEVIGHANPTRDFNNIALRIKSLNPDIVIPANYYNEYVLLARTMQQQKVVPKAIYSVLGGAASNYKFVKEFPDAAQRHHRLQPLVQSRSDRRAGAEEAGRGEGPVLHLRESLNYSACCCWPTRIERAGSADRAKITDALANSHLRGPLHALRADQVRQRPERGRAPVITQVLKGDIQVIVPANSPRPSRCSRAGLSPSAGRASAERGECSSSGIILRRRS